MVEIGILINDIAGVYTFAYKYNAYGATRALNWEYSNGFNVIKNEIQLMQYDISDIDQMRANILAHVNNNTAFDVFGQGLLPYNLLTSFQGDQRSVMGSQEGLAITTYFSDVYNNWLDTDWISGTGGVTDKTKIDTTAGSFTIDTLLIKKKLYDMLNRIAMSGGTLSDYIEAVYGHKMYLRAISPMYAGGLSKELVFQEVVSQSEAPSNTEGGVQPLGSLAGRGRLSSKHHGGKIIIKADEYTMIMGLYTITPHIDYSQGNDFDVYAIKTVADFHNPNLDGIGFQESINEGRAWWSTFEDGGAWKQTSAGKIPSWINYQTYVNQVYGNFAIKNNEDFMVMTRDYKPVADGNKLKIGDLTTYVDPRKCNRIFAQTSLDSMNFWVHARIGHTARIVMSANQIPNL